MQHVWVTKKKRDCWRYTAGLLILGAVLLGLGAPGLAVAQQRIGYVDSQYILDNLPEYATVEQKLDQLEQQWREEIQQKREEVQALQEEFRAWELLYTEEEREQKQEEITQARQEVEQLRERYFGPEGELYSRQQELMRPIQERILEAVETVATAEGYDYVLDRKGEALFMFARESHDLSDQVLQELGINVDRQDEGR